MSVRILRGDCRAMLKTLPSDSVHCCVTSPPYWGLRSYLPDGHPEKHLEIGSEPTVHEWVQTMVEVFREVRRVLRPDGTLWLNLGDSYAGSGRGGNVGNGSSGLAGKQTDHSRIAQAARRPMTQSARRDNHLIPRSDVAVPGLKAKDLVGQPWRVAFALQADGWWLRQEIIWGKKNPMPESCRDRFTKAHEQVFLLAKSERYYFDFDAIQEEASQNTHERRASTGVGFGHGYDEVEKPRYRVPGNKDHKGTRAYEAGDEHHRTKGGLVAYSERQRKLAEVGSGTKNNGSFDEAMATMPATRNPRSVRHIDEDEYAQFLRWKAEQSIAPDVRALASEPFKGAHYATYPPELIEPFIKAGCPEGGTVLDPFGGSGTTGLVADRLHRDAILIDLDERNVPMARGRITGDAPLFAEVSA